MMEYGIVPQAAVRPLAEAVFRWDTAVMVHLLVQGRNLS